MTIYEENGKYYCRFKIHGEQKHLLCHGAKSKKEAQAIEDAEKTKLRQQQAGLIPREIKKTKFYYLLNMYENYAKENKKSFEKFDKYALKVIRQYFKSSINAEDIKYLTLEKFKQYLSKERKSAANTINKYMGILSKTYNLGIAQKLVSENPVRNIKKQREPNYKVRYLTKEEEERLFNSINKEIIVTGRDRKIKYIKPYKHLEPIIICALQTGMRKSEILELKWSNIDFEYGYIELLETKSGQSRKIPISEKLNSILCDLKQNNNEYVFVNPQTNTKYKDIHNSFKSVKNEANINNFRFHDLRHTVATRMVEKGIGLVEVKDILGHSKIETTMRYAHPVPSRKLDAIKVLNDY